MALRQRQSEVLALRRFASTLALGHNPSTSSDVISGHMVVYDLACGNEHTFEGWFASSDIFDQQLKDEEVCCPVCGSRNVSRKPSAPNITKHRQDSTSKHGDLPTEAMRELQKDLLEFVMQNSEDVGRAFPEEARRIRNQQAQPRLIRGQATLSEARELRDEGIEVALLPMAPVPRDQLH